MELIEPLITVAKRGGNKRTAEIRVVADAVMSVLSMRSQWRALPRI